MPVDLDGVDQSLTVADDPALRLNDMSIAIWFLKSAEPSLTFPRLIGKGTPEADGNYGIFHRNSDDLMLFQIRDTVGGRVDVFGTTAIALDTWYHVVGTFDSTANIARIYLNGVEEASTATGAQIPINTTDPVTIGTGLFSAFWNGLLDDPRIYNRALSVGEVEEIHALQGKDRIDDFVAGWRMDEFGPGVTISGADSLKDRSGNGHDASPVNSPVGGEGVLSFGRMVA